jgi:hypothetical protein
MAVISIVFVAWAGDESPNAETAAIASAESETFVINLLRNMEPPRNTCCFMINLRISKYLYFWQCQFMFDILAKR